MGGTMGDVASRERSNARWLTRPGKFQRFVNVVAGVVAAVCGIGPIAGAMGTPAVWWGLPVYVVAGIMFSGQRRVGARVHRGAVELHTIVSCTRVPLADITRIHVGPDTAFVAIEHGAIAHELVTYGHQSLNMTEELLSNARDLGGWLGVPVLEYSDVESYVEGVRPKHRAGWSARGFLSVLGWREVWITTLVASVVLIAPMGFIA